MEKAVFDDYVENRYKKQMEFYSKASAKNQKRYKQFQWTLIILSAATPILAALASRGITEAAGDAAGYSALQIIVVVISGVVAILTAGLKTFSYQELWITYRVTYEKLKPEIHYYHFSVGPYADPGIDKESLFVATVEAILDAEHKQWPPAKKLQEEQNRGAGNGGGGNGGGGNAAPAPREGQPVDVSQPADQISGAPEESREIVDESGHSDEIAQANEILGEPEELREIADESGESDDIAQAEEIEEPDVAGEPDIAKAGEAVEDVQPDEEEPKQT